MAGPGVSTAGIVFFYLESADQADSCFSGMTSVVAGFGFASIVALLATGSAAVSASPQ
jgi:hypothetical protein